MEEGEREREGKKIDGEGGRGRKKKMDAERGEGGREKEREKRSGGVGGVYKCGSKYSCR